MRVEIYGGVVRISLFADNAAEHYFLASEEQRLAKDLRLEFLGLPVSKETEELLMRRLKQKYGVWKRSKKHGFTKKELA